MNGSDEKGSNIERINFAQQGMAENAQFAIAIAIGIFGILTMFLMINHPPDAENVELNLNFGNSFWTKGSWTMVEGIVLSAAYWALVLFGFQSYISRRLFEGLMGYYVKTMHEDITGIAAENKLANWMVKRIWASNYEKKDRYKHLSSVIFLYFALTFFLWFFVATF
jgi:hypothetical protein